MQTVHSIWADKYRPRDIKEYVFQDDQLRHAVTRMIAAKSIPQVLLEGVQGSGKTTLAYILIDALDLHPADVMIIHASDERGIDVFRDKIKSFSTTMPMGAFKLILLEEADQLTLDAQKAMKSFSESYSDTVRFIMTCNNVNKIIIELRSRFQVFSFRAPDREATTEQLATILAREKVKFNLELLDRYIAIDYPDIRKIINCLEQNTVDGKLMEPRSGTSAGTDYKFKIIDMIETGDWTEARKLVCANMMPNQWENFYRFLYENIERAPSFQDHGKKWEEAIIIIADHLYKNSIVADPEINAAAMLIQLGQL